MLANHDLPFNAALLFFINNKPFLCNTIEWNDVNNQVHSSSLMNMTEWKDLVNHHFQIMNNKIRRFGGTIEGVFVVHSGVGRVMDDYDGDNRNNHSKWSV